MSGSPSSGAAVLIVKVDNASTFSRCILIGELEGVCISKVSINGSTIATPGAAPQPLHIEVERKTKSIGACAGLTRGIGLISREAVIKFIETVAARASSGV